MTWADFEALPPASVYAPVPVTTVEEPVPPGPALRHHPAAWAGSPTGQPGHRL